MQILTIRCFPAWLAALFLLQSCAGSKPPHQANARYSKQKLQRDYTVFRNILEEGHPSLYWYTSKDSMDYYFNQGYQKITDSMTEPQFRAILSYVVAQIHCGHTSTRYSKKYLHYLDTARLPGFPVNIKILDKDTIVLNSALKRREELLPKGTILTSLNGTPFTKLADSLARYIPQDGWNTHYLQQTLSNRGALGGWLRLVSGYAPKYDLGYIDSLGVEKTWSFQLMKPIRSDSARKPLIPDIRNQIKWRGRREKNLTQARSVQIDTSLSTAYLEINTFNNGYQLRSFFRNVFKELDRTNIRHLVIDIRSNGGGNVAHSTYLTQKIRNTPFKLADSLYAVSRKNHTYGQYVRYNFLTGIFMRFITRKKSDGYYHFGYFERKRYKPSKSHFYSGNVYVLTGANSFSAAAIFAKTVKGQSNVTLVGEETGGAAYGNSAWFIPDVRLPETGVRFRLPKFRLVIDSTAVKDGRGVLPDIEVKATRQSVMENRDLKVETVRSLITRKSTLP